MAVITVSINDKTKMQAEEIANSIGLSLNAVINVFVNRFVAERGFPFAVSDTNTAQVFDGADLSSAVSRAIKERRVVPEVPDSFFVNPETNVID